jgi:hypothetical protein
MIIRGVADHMTGMVYASGVMFDPWEAQIAAQGPWPGLGPAEVGVWYENPLPPELCAGIIKVGQESCYTFFRRPIDINRKNAWEAGDTTQVTSLTL